MRVLERVARLAAGWHQTPAAFVLLVEDGQEQVVATHGLEAATVGQDRSFGAYTMQHEKVLTVLDARADERFATSPLGEEDPRRNHVGEILRATVGASSVVQRLTVFQLVGNDRK